MKFSDTWIPYIIQSFTVIGQKASGYLDASPDGIVAYGVDMAMNMLAVLVKLGLGDVAILFLPIGFFAILIFIAFCVVAGQLFKPQSFGQVTTKLSPQRFYNKGLILSFGIVSLYI